MDASWIVDVARSRTGTGSVYLTNFYDTTGRLTSTQLRSNDHSVINLHGYAYNAASPREMTMPRPAIRPACPAVFSRQWRTVRLSHGASQRVLGTRTNTSAGATYSLRTGYSYDDAGQLTVAWVTNSAGSLVSAESRGYAYDPAQNLAKRTNNAAGSTVTATVNALNQLTAGLGFSSYTYDRRGNLTFADAGSWAHAFTYDHENQCVSAGGYYGPAKSEYVYDGKGRLRVRKDWSWTGSGWSPHGEVRYLYDGLRVIQERHAGNTPTVGYTRGLDLSGTPAGAGGIGGLLGRSTYSGGAWGGHAYYHADGNGNITYLLNQNRSHGASYKYDPYGRLIASSGTLASANTLRFSSKEWHASAGLYYYGYRFYLPEAQRWPNRDPINELGHGLLRSLSDGETADGDSYLGHVESLDTAELNEYAFVANNPVTFVDPLGLKRLVEPCNASQ